MVEVADLGQHRRDLFFLVEVGEKFESDFPGSLPECCRARARPRSLAFPWARRWESAAAGSLGGALGGDDLLNQIRRPVGDRRAIDRRRREESPCSPPVIKSPPRNPPAYTLWPSMEHQVAVLVPRRRPNAFHVGRTHNGHRGYDPPYDSPSSAFNSLKSAGDVTNAADTIKGVIEQARNYAMANSLLHLDWVL